LHSLELLAPADAIPEAITIDLSGMDFHDSVHVSAIKLPEGCRPADLTSDFTVVTIVPPTVFQEEAPAAAAATSTAAPAAAAGAPVKGSAAAPAKGAAAAPAKGAAAAPAKGAAAPKPAAKK
jgi:large subunit ribosomal protein L25